MLLTLIKGSRKCSEIYLFNEHLNSLKCQKTGKFSLNIPCFNFYILVYFPDLMIFSQFLTLLCLYIMKCLSSKTLHFLLYIR